MRARVEVQNRTSKEGRYNSFMYGNWNGMSEVVLVVYCDCRLTRASEEVTDSAGIVDGRPVLNFEV